jgi:hypothetical protein
VEGHVVPAIRVEKSSAGLGLGAVTLPCSLPGAERLGGPIASPALLEGDR